MGIVNATKSRRAARCRNAQAQSSLLPQFVPTSPCAPQEAAWRVLQEWLAAPSGGLYIFGTPGTGKTALAAAATVTLRDREVPVHYLKAKHALDMLRCFEKPGYVEVVRARLAGAEVLVLDDLGAHQSTPYAIEELTEVFDHRHDQNLPTIVTSNLTGPELSDALGGRLGDRIMGLCRAVKMDGESLR